MKTIIGPKIILKYLKQFPIQILINTALPLKPPPMKGLKRLYFSTVYQKVKFPTIFILKSLFLSVIV